MKILVTGPNANSMRCLNGGWTYLWQGHMTDELPISKNYKTILAAMQDRFGKDNVVYEPGMTYGLTVSGSVTGVWNMSGISTRL